MKESQKHDHAHKIQGSTNFQGQTALHISFQHTGRQTESASASTNISL